jgi:pimeloyl-ACP methyl ester carboxylesterase
MRLFPSDIRSVILDSAVPTQINLFNTFPSAKQHAYDTLFQGCAASSNCRAMYPQLESVFYQLVNDLNAKPITFQDIQYGPVALDGDGLASWVFSMLYVTPLIPFLPAAIMQTSQGNYTVLSRYYGLLMRQEDFSHGMYYSVECGEDMAFTTTQELANATASMHPEVQPGVLAGLQGDFSICQFWGERPVPRVQKQPVTSALPTLILSGKYDPITPASNAKLALQTLSHGYLFQFPATGHGVFNTHPCPDSIVAAFLQQPMTKPDDSCIARMPEPDFR